MDGSRRWRRKGQGEGRGGDAYGADEFERRRHQMGTAWPAPARVNPIGVWTTGADL